MKLEKTDFIEKYIQYCIEMEKAMKKNDYRTNNKYAKRLTKLNQECKNEEYYISALNDLIDNANLKVSAVASADSLRQNANIDKAIKKLEYISSRKDFGIISFGAQMTLEIWTKYGAKGLE